MTILKTTLFAAAASLALAGAASAAEVSTNIGIANDYVFRGLDQTANYEGQLFVGADVTEDNIYGGIWVSNTGPEHNVGVEYDLYAGIKPTFAGLTFDLGAVFYGYTGDPLVNSSLNTLEYKAAVSYPVGEMTVGAAVYYSPKNGGFADEKTTYLEVNGSYTVSGATISGAYGNFSVDTAGLSEYNTWNIGVTYPFMDRYSVDVRYHGSDDDAKTLFNSVANPDIADSHIVATLKATF